MTTLSTVQKQVPPVSSTPLAIQPVLFDGYRAVWGRIKPGAYGDYISINEGSILLQNGKASIADAYLGNWSSTTISVTVYFEVLWIKN